jgi:DNA-binding LytR/AlgR family response regulator
VVLLYNYWDDPKGVAVEPTSQPSVLVIDDDGEILTMLDRMLSLDGFEVALAQDSEEGLVKATEVHPDIIVLDVMMPGKSGIDVMRELRSNDDTSDIPILFLSAVTDESVVVQGLKGADDYVIKPFKPLELEARIHKILQRVDSAKAAGPAVEAPERLAVQIGYETHLVPPGDIIIVEAAGKYAYAYTSGKRYLTGYSIGDLEERLAPSGKFLRVHRSFLVNLDYVEKVTRDERRNAVLVLSNIEHSHVKVSDKYLPAVRAKLGF